jgi:hypothetical protein
MQTLEPGPETGQGLKDAYPGLCESQLVRAGTNLTLA